jgi:hypothetical protein
VIRHVSDSIDISDSVSVAVSRPAMIELQPAVATSSASMELTVGGPTIYRDASTGHLNLVGTSTENFIKGRARILRPTRDDWHMAGTGAQLGFLLGTVAHYPVAGGLSGAGIGFVGSYIDRLKPSP